MAEYKVVVDMVKRIWYGTAPATCSEVFMDNGKNRVVDKYSVELREDLSIGVVPEV